MEPIQPEVRRAILEANPLAEPQDIDEYEQLLAARFTVDPDAPVAAPLGVDAMRSAQEDRLAVLHRKLFPGANR